MKLFLLGLLAGVLIVCPLGAYLYVNLGFLSLATTAKPLPGEESLAHTALRKSIGTAENVQDPLPVTDDNLLAGAKQYREQCAVCHGLPGQPKTMIAAGMFPPPPQLLKGHGVTDDPEGTAFWKISNGIRLSGMPRFDTMPESARWQVTMFLKHADKLPPGVAADLRP
jgi:mono/diheme cytochrome c family protein